MKNKIVKYGLWGIGIIVLIFVGLLINYRFVIYPSDIRTECDKYARKAVAKSYETETTAYKLAYDSCFRQHGLQPERN